MTTMKLDWILKATGGEALSTHAQSFHSIGTDTRVDLSGQLFVALVGDQFDAHHFLSNAVAKGASALLVHRLSEKDQALLEKVTVIQVQDTLKALQDLARSYRQGLNVKVLGLTGSNGKTTTKEFLTSILSSFKKVHSSKGSFNNHWGVPLTLLQIPPEAEMAVVEMGMNHAGEITELVKIADPDVVMCTMVGRAHIEHFGTVDKIADAKEEIYEAASETAIRVYNLDNPWTLRMFQKARTRFPKAKIFTFSEHDSKADVSFKISRMNMRQIELVGRIASVEGQVSVPVFGAQNLTNLMAAAAEALAIGLTPAEIWQGLAQCRTAWGRNQFVRLKVGAEMIFDAYNANPDSMAALLDNMKLVEVAGKKRGVFGQMRELGDQSADLHRELGERVGQVGFDSVYFIGSDEAAFRSGLEASGFQGTYLGKPDYTDEMGLHLAKSLGSQDLVVVKASRGTRLERFVHPCEPLDFGEK